MIQSGNLKKSPLMMIWKDLWSPLINLQNPKDITEESVASFFTPILTDEELKLQEGNEEYLKTYLYYDMLGLNPDVDVEEMKKSDSKSKYVHGRCLRKKIPLNLSTEESDDSDETDYFDKIDDSSSETSWSEWSSVKFSIFEIFDDLMMNIFWSK